LGAGGPPGGPDFAPVRADAATIGLLREPGSRAGRVISRAGSKIAGK